jgi:hypothetical protein
MVRDQIGPVAPFEIAAGESEEDGSHDGRISAYASCLPDRMNAVGQYASQYYLDMGTIARVIVISPNLTVNGTTFSYGRNDPEYGWLGNAIDSAHDAGIVWVVVAMNEDCISAGIYYCNISQDLLSLMINKHVDLVLSAHDHTYQRSRQILAPAPGCPEVLIDSFNPRCVANDRRDGPFHRRGGTIFTVVGSGSNNLYPINQRQPDAPYLAATMGKNKQPDPGFLLLTLSKASINGRFVRTGGGTFADQFTVSSSTASAARTSNAARPPASAGGVKRPGVAA